MTHIKHCPTPSVHARGGICQDQRFYVVQDPGPASTLPDICYSTTLAIFARICVGCAQIPYQQREAEFRSLAIYFDEADAVADAEARLIARKEHR